MEQHIRIEHASKSTPQSLSDKQGGVGSFQPSPPAPPAPQFNIARDKKIRQVIPPKMYAEVDLVVYALNVAKSIDNCETHSTYKEVVSFKASNRWMIIMQEEIESLNKKDT